MKVRKTKKAKGHKSIKLPGEFKPRFWSEADQRCSIVRLIRKRMEQLRKDAGVDCAQQEMLAQRAVFLAIQLETMENVACSTGELDFGVYTQAANALSGLLTKLGLKKKGEASHVDLHAYLKNQKKRA